MISRIGRALRALFGLIIINMINNEINASNKYIQSIVLKNLIAGGATFESEIQASMEYLELPVETAYNPAFIFVLKPAYSGNSETREILEKLLDENLAELNYDGLVNENEKYFIVTTIFELKVIILNINKNNIAKTEITIKKWEEILLKTMEKAKLLHGFDFAICQSYSVKKASGFSVRRKKSKSKNNNIENNNNFSSKIKSNIDFNFSVFGGNFMPFVFFLNYGEKDLLQKITTKLFNDISQAEIDTADKFENIKNMLSNMFLTIAEHFNYKQGIDFSFIAEKNYGSKLLESVNNKEELAEFAKDVLKKLADGIEEHNKNDSQKNSRIIIKIKKYIHENISKPFNSDEIARHYNISSSYMSRVFKQKTGENLSDYISRTRIETAATLLLQPNIRIQDICQKAGINNPSYFALQFKKYTGYTPTEYCWAILDRK